MKTSRYGTIHKTRFAELGFTMLEPRDWRFIDRTDPDEPRQVGGIKAALEAAYDAGRESNGAA